MEKNGNIRIRERRTKRENNRERENVTMIYGNYVQLLNLITSSRMENHMWITAIVTPRFG